MKKAISIGISVMLIVLPGFPISVPLVNHYTAKASADIPLPESAELCETFSAAGKLVGNGNGMQYFGAILLRDENARPEALQDYYQNLLYRPCMGA